LLYRTKPQKEIGFLEKDKVKRKQKNQCKNEKVFFRTSFLFLQMNIARTFKAKLTQ